MAGYGTGIQKILREGGITAEIMKFWIMMIAMIAFVMEILAIEWIIVHIYSIGFTIKVLYFVGEMLFIGGMAFLPVLMIYYNEMEERTRDKFE